MYFVLSLLFLGAASAAPALDNSCAYGFIQHYSNYGAVSPSSDRPPFEIYIDDDDLDFEPGDDAEIAVRSTGRGTFKAFYLEAVSADGGNDPVGRWRSGGYATKTVCNGNQGLTQSFERNMRYAEGDWYGNSRDGDVIFIAHVVAEDGTYYEGIRSSLFRLERRGGGGGWGGGRDQGNDRDRGWGRQDYYHSSEESDESWESWGW